MRFVIKLLISVGIIVFCTQIGRKLPTLAGLIAVMPLTGLIVLLWLHTDKPQDFALLAEYTKGALCRAFCFFSLPLCVFASTCRCGLCFAQALGSGSWPLLYISAC